MSSYRASLSTGTRSGGQSASAKHRYQNRQDIYLVGREGLRDDLAASGSGNLPAFADGDAGKFWLAADSFERKNARLFVELQLNLPAELSLEQQIRAVKNYASKLCDEESLPFSWVIHHGKGENPHCHLMINETKNDSIERPAEQHFKRFNSKFPERGGAQKTAALKPTQWLLDARGAWAIAANDALEKAGFERHFDHRTLEDQRISALLAKDWRKAARLDREVGEHEGWRVAALRRKFESGELDELPEYARKVIEKNDRIKALGQQHLAMVDSMTDEQLERWEREAYFEALAEHEPERLDAEIEQLHTEALELDGQLEPEPEPQPQPEPQPELEQLHTEALELDGQLEPEQQASRLDELKAELEAQDAALGAQAKQAKEADRFAAQQAKKASELEKHHKQSMQQQKSLEAQADALEPRGLKAFFAFVARLFGLRTQSDQLREQAKQLARQREQQRDQLLDARAQAQSAKAESAEARQGLLDAKAQRAELADALMLEHGTDALKEMVAREVQKLEKLEDDFEKLGSSKGFEIQQQREAITQGAERSDKELLQQAKDLNRLVKSAACGYRDELFEASAQAQGEAEGAYHQAREVLRRAGEKLGSEYRKEVEKQLNADRSHFFELMKDSNTRLEPRLFKELASDTRELHELMQQHMQQAEQLERQQREAAPRQRQEHKSNFGLKI